MFSLCVTLRRNRVPYLLYKHADYVKLILVNTGCWRIYIYKKHPKTTRYCSRPDSNSSNMTHEALNHHVSLPVSRCCLITDRFLLLLWCKWCELTCQDVMQWVTLTKKIGDASIVGDISRVEGGKKKKARLVVDSWSIGHMEHLALFFFVPPANCLTRALCSLTSAKPPTKPAVSKYPPSVSNRVP